MSGEARSSSCLAEGTRRHFRKFCAFARFVRRDVIMAMIIGSAKSDPCSPLHPGCLGASGPPPASRLSAGPSTVGNRKRADCRKTKNDIKRHLDRIYFSSERSCLFYKDEGNCA